VIQRLSDLLADAWDRFLLYLPLAVMAVLALGTYWMVRSSSIEEAPRGAKPEQTGPDYFMDGFSVKTFDAQGRVRSEVLGDKARHFPQNKWTEIDNILIRSFDEQGRLTTAAAARGLTNEDGSEVQLIGNAIVVRESQSAAGSKAQPRMEYRGEFLHAFLNSERIQSHKPVLLKRGKDSFSADRLDFDNIEQVVQLDGRVRGTLVPEPRK